MSTNIDVWRLVRLLVNKCILTKFFVIFQNFGYVIERNGKKAYNEQTTCLVTENSQDCSNGKPKFVIIKTILKRRN